MAAPPSPHSANSKSPASDASKSKQSKRTPSIVEGIATLKAAVKTLPARPGVYRMLDAAGDALYVGKARNLKKRVTSYTTAAKLTERLARMVSETVSLEVVTTRSEVEALLLEQNMIKKLMPRFNVLLRDDKSFPYIFVTGDRDCAQITKFRGTRKRPGDYYGPFASAGAVNRTLRALQRAFLLRSCSDGVFAARRRPCLLYQIKRCSAPCTGEIDLDGYATLVKEAKAFLSGRSRMIQADLATAMEAASETLDFETAAKYRDRLAALSHVRAHQGINPQSVEEADVFAIHQDGGMACIQVFFFRTGQNWGNRAYFPKADKSLSPAEILSSFIAQFYDGKPVPKQVLVSDDFGERALLAEALSQKAERKVTVNVPARGEKKELVEHALTNAREALGRKLAETSSQARLLKALGETLGLERPLRRVEVYDNSHVMGTNAVGGMIVAGPEGFSKPHYRKFNIRSEDLVPGDDYGMMREVIQRRFSRLIKEMGRPAESEPEAGDEDNSVIAEDMPAWPDLLIIDGGKGQLSAVLEIMKEMDLADLPIVAISKGADREAGREMFHQPRKTPYSLPHRDPVLYFIQRLRDEAHRFAIGSHRVRRKKSMTANPLDEIAGIGPSRKKALLRHFGTAKEVGRAGLNDLMTVDGISRQTAELIYDHFHEGSD